MELQMLLLLTILSVLAFWAFLNVLIIGLYLIFKPLEGVRIYLEKITMGVRAIERQTRPLAAYSEEAGGKLEATNVALQKAGRRLNMIEIKLDTAARSGKM
jgi:hypothetical protein